MAPAQCRQCAGYARQRSIRIPDKCREAGKPPRGDSISLKKRLSVRRGVHRRAEPLEHQAARNQVVEFVNPNRRAAAPADMRTELHAAKMPLPHINDVFDVQPQKIVLRGRQSRHSLVFKRTQHAFQDTHARTCSKNSG